MHSSQQLREELHRLETVRSTLQFLEVTHPYDTSFKSVVVFVGGLVGPSVIISMLLLELNTCCVSFAAKAQMILKYTISSHQHIVFVVQIIRNTYVFLL